jgi:hypothetical protein
MITQEALSIGCDLVTMGLTACYMVKLVTAGGEKLTRRGLSQQKELYGGFAPLAYDAAESPAGLSSLDVERSEPYFGGRRKSSLVGQCIVRRSY